MFLVYQPMYLFRRLTLPIVIVLLPNVLLAQYMWVQFTGSAICCYVAYKQPFTSKAKNVATLVEEMTIIVLVYHILCFTQWVVDPSARHNLGFSFVTIVTSILFIFHFVGLKQAIGSVVNFLKRRYQIKKAKHQAASQDYKAKFILFVIKSHAARRQSMAGQQSDERASQRCAVAGSGRNEHVGEDGEELDGNVSAAGK